MRSGDASIKAEKAAACQSQGMKSAAAAGRTYIKMTDFISAMKPRKN
jgi:hypothetical protein